MTTVSAVPAVAVPYSGTIYVNDSVKGTAGKSQCKQFYEIPNRLKGKISIIVQASAGAEILLYDQSPTEKWALKITLGLNNSSSNSSIGLNTRDPVQESTYPTLEFPTPAVLDGNDFKAFIIQWTYGVVKVLDDGADTTSELLSWKGPADMRIGHFGVRTLGSKGVWRVQGGPEFTTTESTDIATPYQEYQVNSGRLDFEIRGSANAYVILSEKPNDENTDGMIHLLIGWQEGTKTYIEESLASVASYVHPTILSAYQYRRFWAEWDAYSVRFGTAGDVDPKLVYNSTNPITQLNYFGFTTDNGHKACFRIVDNKNDTKSQSTIGSL